MEEKNEVQRLREYCDWLEETDNGKDNITLYEQALKAGLEVDHHYSDLYIKYTPEARRLVKDYKHSCFLDSNGELWIEIPFYYDPFWRKGKYGATHNRP
jgi:hypothetical protein